jgi:hypothetical protein
MGTRVYMVGCVLYPYVKNRRMKPVEIVLRREEGGKKENGRVNPTKIYFKHIYNYHSVSPCTTIIC